MFKVIWFFIFTVLCFNGHLALAHQLEGPYEYPFYAKTHVNDQEDIGNQMRILNSGIASLQLRLEMIRRAKHSIELEYFIFQDDLSAKLIVHELIKKAKEGVKIRLLIDKSITVIRFDEYYAAELMRYKNIQVAYYNRALDPGTAQYRNHRKLLSVDRQEAITGGRNIGLDYFDLDPDYNFFDRDVWVKGKIVEAMVDSFNLFWKSSRTKIAQLPKVPEFSRLHRSQQRRNTAKLKVHERRKREAAEFIRADKNLIDFSKKVEEVALPYLEKTETHICPQITFVSDRPGGTLLSAFDRSYKKEDRLLNQFLKDKLKSARHEVLMDSPYFMVNDSFGDMLNDLLERGVEVSVLTNSLVSTDAIYVATNFYRQIDKWIKRGLRTYVFSSKWHAEESDVTIKDSIKKMRYGVHSKSYIVDGQDFTIGTYNIDNRSDYFNVEMSLFCEGSPELSKILKNNIETRIQNSYLLLETEKAINHKNEKADPYAGASDMNIFLMKTITLPAYLLEFIM